MQYQEREQRAQELLQILEPCLKKAKKETHWSTIRYNTKWGSKSPTGMVAIITRIMYEEPKR